MNHFSLQFPGIDRGLLPGTLHMIWSQGDRRGNFIGGSLAPPRAGIFTCSLQATFSSQFVTLADGTAPGQRLGILSLLLPAFPTLLPTQKLLCGGST